LREKDRGGKENNKGGERKESKAFRIGLKGADQAKERIGYEGKWDSEGRAKKRSPEENEKGLPRRREGSPFQNLPSCGGELQKRNQLFWRGERERALKEIRKVCG